MLHHGAVRELLPVVLPVLAGLLLRRVGAVLAAFGLPCWVLWLAADNRGPDDLGLALAFALVGGGLLGSAGALLRSRLRRRTRDVGSTW